MHSTDYNLQQYKPTGLPWEWDLTHGMRLNSGLENCLCPVVCDFTSYSRNFHKLCSVLNLWAIAQWCATVLEQIC